jgi:hypothetical protein
MASNETIRRLRYGDILKIIRRRYRQSGYVLPDDDAGREDLFELLLPISLGQGGDRKMRLAIGLYAPWMSPQDTEELIDRINLTPDSLRKPSARLLGQRMNLLSHDRKAWRIQTIRPVDMTDAELAEQRLATDRDRKQRRRRKAGSKPREIYLAKSRTRNKPWERDGISRAQWYRRQKKAQAAAPVRQFPMRQVRPE